MYLIHPSYRKHKRYLHRLEEKKVALLTSAGRGIHMTVVCRMNPYRHCIPPAFIVPSKNWKNELIENAPLEA
jgi:hypothetical protein